MKLLLSILLLLWAPSAKSASSDHLVVTQSPDVSVLEGQTVNIFCCWTGRQSRFSITWLRNNKSVKNETIQNQNSKSPEEQANNCSLLIFTNILSKDSGKYTCRVIVVIPSLTVAEGNGTTITVTARENTPDDSATTEISNVSWRQVMMIFILRCLPILILITVFICVQYLGTKAQQNSSDESRNKPTSAPSSEEDHGEDEGHERETEAGRD